MRGLTNCPLAALLAALAFAPDGRKHTLGLVREHAGTAETDRAGAPAPPPVRLSTSESGRQPRPAKKSRSPSGNLPALFALF